jgi:hypothetical protein
MVPAMSWTWRSTGRRLRPSRRGRPARRQRPHPRAADHDHVGPVGDVVEAGLELVQGHVERAVDALALELQRRADIQQQRRRHPLLAEGVDLARGDGRRVRVPQVVPQDARHVRRRSGRDRQPPRERPLVPLAEERVRRLLLADRRHRPSDVVVAGVHDRVVGERLEGPEGPEEVRRAPAHEVGPSRATREQRVPGEEVALHEERQRVGRVPGGVEDRDGPRAERERRAAPEAAGRPGQLRRRVRQDGGARPPGEPAHPREVIRVRVGVEDVGQPGPARREALQEAIDLVQARIDRDRGMAGLVHQEVAEAALVGPIRLDGQRGGARQRRHRRSLLL